MKKQRSIGQDKLPFDIWDFVVFEFLPYSDHHELLLVSKATSNDVKRYLGTMRSLKISASFPALIHGMILRHCRSLKHITFLESSSTHKIPKSHIWAARLIAVHAHNLSRVSFHNTSYCYVNTLFALLPCHQLQTLEFPPSLSIDEHENLSELLALLCFQNRLHKLSNYPNDTFTKTVQDYLAPTLQSLQLTAKQLSHLNLTIFKQLQTLIVSGDWAFSLQHLFDMLHSTLGTQLECLDICMGTNDTTEPNKQFEFPRLKDLKLELSNPSLPPAIIAPKLQCFHLICPNEDRSIVEKYCANVFNTSPGLQEVQFAFGCLGCLSGLKALTCIGVECKRTTTDNPISSLPRQLETFGFLLPMEPSWMISCIPVCSQLTTLDIVLRTRDVNATCFFEILVQLPNLRYLALIHCDRHVDCIEVASDHKIIHHAQLSKLKLTGYGPSVVQRLHLPVLEMFVYKSGASSEQNVTCGQLSCHSTRLQSLDISCDALDCATLTTSLTSLNQLIIRRYEPLLTQWYFLAKAFPNVRTLHVHLQHVASSVVYAIISSGWANLEKLSFSCSKSSTSKISVDAIITLFERYPQLHWLQLDDNTFNDAKIKEAVEWKKDMALCGKIRGSGGRLTW